MPVHLREQFEARVTSVVRASALPEVLLALQITRWVYGASVEEVSVVLTPTDPALAREYARWAA